MIKYTLERAGDLKDQSKLMSFGDFLEHHGLELVAKEREGQVPGSVFRYIAYIRCGHIEDASCKECQAGGCDPQEAITNLANLACGKVLIIRNKNDIDESLPNRYIQFPNEWLSILD